MMTTRRMVWTTTLAMIVGMGGLLAPATPATADELTQLLEQMPADLAIAGVITDVEELDRNVVGMLKRLDPESEHEALLGDVRAELSFAAAVDFGKPLALAFPAFGPNMETPVLWLYAPEFAGRAAGFENVKKTEKGDWEVMVAGEQMLARAKGPYLVLAGNATDLDKATSGTTSMAGALGSRVDELRKRDVYVRFSLESVRSMILMQLSQAGAMLPMMLMSAPQQGMDPMFMTGIATTALDGTQKFVEQVDYIELLGEIDAQHIGVSLVTAYKDGSIKKYLAGQKPPRMAMFNGVEAGSYLMAASFDIARPDSPWLDYLGEQMSKAMAQTPAMPGAPQGDAKKGDATKESIKTSLDMLRILDGTSLAVGFQDGTLAMSGHYMTSDPSRLITLLDKSYTDGNAMMQAMSAGVSYESLGTERIGVTDAHVYTMKFDASNPQMGMAAMMYGSEPRFAFGQTGQSIRFGLGSKPTLEKVFAQSTISNPLGETKQVKEVLSKLPPHQHAILLVDPMGLLPMMTAMMGNPTPPKANAAGDPLALSASMHDGQFDLNLYIPIKSLEQFVKLMSAAEPM
jgi:hypothetical protein